MKPEAMSADDKKWQAESDMRTLAQAIEINKDPKRLAAARELAKQKITDLQKIAK
jgi:CRISPR/Cas system-associated endonuclease Cas1